METNITVLKRWSLFDFFDEQASETVVNELILTEECIACTTVELFVYNDPIMILGIHYRPTVLRVIGVLQVHTLVLSPSNKALNSMFFSEEVF